MNIYENNINENKINVYSSGTNVTGGISLRDEFYGLMDEDLVFQYFVYRRVSDIVCDCVKNSYTKEPDIDIQCKICEGTGRIFKDYLVRGFIREESSINNDRPRFRDSEIGSEDKDVRIVYIASKEIPEQLLDNSSFEVKSRDEIILIELTEDGDIISPITATGYYNISTAATNRLDSHGRIEYYRIRVASTPRRNKNI